MRMRLIATMLICLLIAMPALASPAADTAVREAVEAQLSKEASRTNDSWTKYLLSQPLGAFSESGDAATFSAPGWVIDPDALSGDAEGWLIQLWAQVNQNKVEGSAAYSADNGGVKLTGDGIADYVAQVKRAASAAKAAFDGVRVRQALTERLLPGRWFDEDGSMTEALSALVQVYQGRLTPAELVVALSAAKGASMDPAKGPDKLRIVFFSGDAKALTKTASERALTALSGMDLANQLPDDAIALEFARAFADAAASFRSGSAKGTRRELYIDFAALMTGGLSNESFAAYAESIAAPLREQLPALIEATRALPDYPKRDAPKSGAVLGENEGTKLIFEAPDDALNRYVTLYAEDGSLTLSVFVRPGETAIAYAPMGRYRVSCAAGTDWYGPVAQFGGDGTLSETVEPVEVLDDTHYHTFALDREDGNTPMRDVA